MAYCVHCGVRLGDAEPRCPLCGTEATDPSAPRDPGAPKPYPVRTPEQTLKVSRSYAVTLLSLLLLVPAGLCLLLDLIGGRISWSIYPAGVLVLCWIAMTMPLMVRRHRVYRTILITGATLAGYLYMVEQLSSPGWFFPIVLPALFLFVAMVCFTVSLVRKWKLKAVLVVAAVLVQAASLTLAAELLCIHYGIGEVLSWSPYVLAPCYFIALLLYAVTKNRPLYDEMKRRLHF